MPNYMISSSRRAACVRTITVKVTEQKPTGLVLRFKGRLLIGPVTTRIAQAEGGAVNEQPFPGEETWKS